MASEIAKPPASDDRRANVDLGSTSYVGITDDVVHHLQPTWVTAGAAVADDRLTSGAF
jgi:hypothetical protein